MLDRQRHVTEGGRVCNHHKKLDSVISVDPRPMKAAILIFSH